MHSGRRSAAISGVGIYGALGNLFLNSEFGDVVPGTYSGAQIIGAGVQFYAPGGSATVNSVSVINGMRVLSVTIAGTHTALDNSVGVSFRVDSVSPSTTYTGRVKARVVASSVGSVNHIMQSRTASNSYGGDSGGFTGLAVSAVFTDIRKPSLSSATAAAYRHVFVTSIAANVAYSFTIEIAQPQLTLGSEVSGYVATGAASAAGLLLAGTETGEAHGSPTVVAAPAGVTLALTGTATAEAHGAQSVRPTLALTGTATAEAHGSAIVAGQAHTLTLAGTATAEAHGAQAAGVRLQPSGTATAEAHGTPAVGGAVGLQLTGTVSSEAHGAPLVRVLLGLAGFGSAEAHGVATLGIIVAAEGTASAEAHGDIELNKPPAPVYGSTYGRPAYELQTRHSSVSTATRRQNIPTRTP